MPGALELNRNKEGLFRFGYDGHKTQGLGLPPKVLLKLYHANAVRWFPGILKAQ